MDCAQLARHTLLRRPAIYPILSVDQPGRLRGKCRKGIACRNHHKLEEIPQTPLHLL